MTTRPSDLVTARDVSWQSVASSNVHSALYDESARDFYVRFLRSGPDDIYVYPDRDPAEWDEFRLSTSKGSWIWQHPIDNNWSYNRLTTRAFADVTRDELAPGVRDFLERT